MATATSTATILGRHVWSELMTTDLKGAQTFYDKVVGWTSGRHTSSPQEYYEFKRPDGVPVAGLMQRPEGMPMSVWAMYLAVPNLEEAQAKLTRLGGKPMSEVITVPTVGRMQMVKDPQGAGFYIIQMEHPENSVDQDPPVGDA